MVTWPWTKNLHVLHVCMTHICYRIWTWLKVTERNSHITATAYSQTQHLEKNRNNTILAVIKNVPGCWLQQTLRIMLSYFTRWDPNDVTHCRILPTDKTTQWLVQTTLCRRWCRCLADQLWPLNVYATTTTAGKYQHIPRPTQVTVYAPTIPPQLWHMTEYVHTAWLHNRRCTQHWVTQWCHTWHMGRHLQSFIVEFRKKISFP